ncbi:hypothetical protein BU24DRAFT_339997 [Aaosphaeria arxii CBS 175.79]|uniref:C2H2-type domain-containing protein n=1 Tax=Aaosphaeria arxii CBS 175.79 TaxID=1450172 RepID=A0A6A5Y5U9_9PLEO|nr:uncharacterized protein BU24DRAFT_339997 [Aaosphaeria arxii CBS 175.79]KAF2020922.1 hypothetical protein BU24DRAFT_339997 [Aaosphaeria arxii CBS 175.79]
MESDEPQLQYSTPQPSNSFKRPRRSLQGSTPLSSVSESASPSPRLSGQASLTPEVIEHINGLKHLDDKQIFLLLEAARNGGEFGPRPGGLSLLTMTADRMRSSGPDRSSMSTLGSRTSSYLSVPSSRVTSMMSDPRSSIASTDSSFTHYSAASSRLSTASSRLSTISNASQKNFACTFCDKALKSKPYWKSHEEEFHEQRLTWRCPDCEQIFHAGKRFREHHTKLHGCENCKQPRESGQPTSRKASPCVKKYEIVMHDKDAWGCGFCGCLLTTWEERCEHIALHFEEKRSKWNFTNVILGLLKQPDVSQAWSSMLTQKHGDEQSIPQFTWESKKCNRLRYKLETKWDNRMFDVEKLIEETYELAEIEAPDSNEAPEPIEQVEQMESNDTTELVDCKLEPFEFTPDQRLSSSHGMPPEHAMMDLDPVEPMQTMTPTSMQPPMEPSQWPVSANMTPNTMSMDTPMDAFGGFAANMTPMTTDFSQPQPVPQTFAQTAWPNAGFVSTPDLVNFQQPNAYMNYTPQPQKEVVQVPTSQYSAFARPTSQHSHAGFVRPASQHSNANFAQYPRQSVPPNFLHHQHTGSTSSRRYVPKLINISNSSNRGSQHFPDQPPPPPPKDENRFSRMIQMKRRPSNISQHTVIPHREMGWNDEVNWG